MDELIKQFEENALQFNSAKIKLCKYNNFEYDNIDKVYLIVPAKHKMHTPFKWVIFDENVEEMYLYEDKGIL